MSGMWSAVGNVTSVFTLLAFVVAAVVTVLRMRVNRDMKLVEAARVEDRPELASRALERVTIDAAGLSEQQRFELAMEQLRERRRRLSTVLGTAVALAIVLTVGFIQSSSIERGGSFDKGAPAPALGPERRADTSPTPDQAGGPAVVSARGNEAPRGRDEERELTWRDHLGGVLEPFVLAGRADHALVSAFAAILRSRGDSHPEVQIKKWVEQAKLHAANDMQLPVAQFAYMDLKLDAPFDALDVEDAFERLWDATSQKRSAADMAKVRLAMFELLGEKRQRELIDAWTR